MIHQTARENYKLSDIIFLREPEMKEKGKSDASCLYSHLKQQPLSQSAF